MEGVFKVIISIFHLSREKRVASLHLRHGIAAKSFCDCICKDFRNHRKD